jgi:ankyrin repeat protein
MDRSLEIARYLLDNGADPNNRDKEEMTPLMFAFNMMVRMKKTSTARLH